MPIFGCEIPSMVYGDDIWSSRVGNWTGPKDFTSCYSKYVRPNRQPKIDTRHAGNGLNDTRNMTSLTMRPCYERNLRPAFIPGQLHRSNSDTSRGDRSSDCWPLN